MKTRPIGLGLLSLTFVLACTPDPGPGDGPGCTGGCDAGPGCTSSGRCDAGSGCTDPEGCDGGSSCTDPGGCEPGPSRFGFLAAYSTNIGTREQWAAGGEDLFAFASGLVREVGARFSREFTWVYPRKTPQRTAEEDRVLSLAEADGVTIMATVAIDDFAIQREASMIWLTSMVETFGEIKHWQIHNEVGKRGRYERSADYLELVEAASATIREACPDCVVVMGSMWHDTAYYDAVVEQGDRFVDAYDVHAFSAAELDLVEHLAAKVQAVAPEKPIFVTEMATYSGQPVGVALPEQSEQDQAATLIKWYARAFAAGVDHVFWSQLVEWYEFLGVEDGLFDLTGLVYNGLGQVVPNEEQGRKKEAYQSLLTLSRKIDRFTAATKLGEGQYRFDRPAGPCYVLWCDAPPCQVPSELTGVHTVTGYLGEERQADVSQLPLTELPVFVE